MIEIKKVNITHPEYLSGMRFEIIFNGGKKQFFTEKAFIELRNMITDTLVVNGIEKRQYMFDAYYIDELSYMREQARVEKNWELSDQIRKYLDTKNVFCVDSKDGQVVYHLPLPILSRSEALKKVENINFKRQYNGRKNTNNSSW